MRKQSKVVIRRSRDPEPSFDPIVTIKDDLLCFVLPMVFFFIIFAAWRLAQ